MDENVTVAVPLKSFDEYVNKDDESAPPAYENPTIDFDSGCKDRFFAILFVIHVIIVTTIGVVLGIPALLKIVEQNKPDEIEKPAMPLNFKYYIYTLIGSTLIASFASFLTLSLLQLCIHRIIKFTFIIMIVLQLVLIVVLGFILWPLCFIPGIYLFFILIYVSCIRKRISFSEAHLSAGIAALRQHPSLILLTIFMLIVQILWACAWGLMVIGIADVTGNKFPLYSSQSTNVRTTKTTTSMNQIYSSNSTTVDEPTLVGKIIHHIVTFILLFSMYWGSVTFGNIAHFVAACSVAHWWFPEETNKHYETKRSLKRAFTTNFGTICFGSFFEGIIKAVRSKAQNNRGNGILSCVFLCFINIVEKAVGYLNEWALIFSALTGKGFVQSGKDLFELFSKRGWTVLINDTIIGTTFAIINLGIGLISALLSVSTIYLTTPQSPQQIMILVFAGCIAFLIGILVSSIVTTILTSCIRTVFVCFALNSSALGSTHPDHLEILSNVWNKFYPQEFAKTGLTYQSPQSNI